MMTHMPNLYVHRDVVTSLFDPKDITNSFGYLFVPFSPIISPKTYADPISITEKKVPPIFTKSRERELQTIPHVSHYSTVLTVTPTLAKELGSKIGFFIEGKRELMTLSEYQQEGHQGMNIVGMTLRMRDNEMSEKERDVILKHLAIFKETQQDIMSEESVRPFECLHIGKAAAQILLKELKGEGRVAEVTEIETHLLNTSRFSELVSSRAITEKK